MNNSEIINTKRLLITPFSEKYLTERYVKWLNDPEIVKYSEQRHKTHSLKTCHNYLKSFKNSSNYLWAIEDKLGELGHIGNINAYVDVPNKVADIGLIIGKKDVQRKRFGYEAFCAVCQYLFLNCKIRKITAGTVSINTPMLKLMRKAGMVNDGVQKKQCIINGEEIDIIMMALFRTDLIFNDKE